MVQACVFALSGCIALITKEFKGSMLSQVGTCLIEMERLFLGLSINNDIGY